MEKINVLSLFDGLGGARLALKLLGIDCNYYASEIEKNSIKIQNKNFPDTINLGNVHNINVSELPKIDLLIGGSPCFAAGELVLTDAGYKPIENIVEGDMVLTHKGRFKKVLKTGQSFKQIWIVKGMGNPGIRTTEEHPFYTRFRYYKRNTITKKPERLFKEPEWTPVNELTKYHYAGITIHNETTKKSEYSEKFWYLIGRYTGDGWYRKTKRKQRKNSFIYQFIICCGKHEFDELNEIFLNSGYNYNYIEERTGFKFRIYSQKLVEFVEPIGKGASNKIIHPLLFSETDDNIRAFLKGYFDSDGFFDNKKREYTVTSTSKKLILGAQYLITKALHVKTTMIYVKRPDTHIIENRIITQKNYYRVLYKSDVRKQDKGFYENNYSWLPIKKISKTDDYETVYNLEVEEDNSYTINNFVVHNCQSLSQLINSTGGLEGFDGKSKLFFEYLRLLKEVKPTYFLLENVASMKKIYSDQISEYLGVQPIKIESALMTAQLRKRLYWTNIPNVTQPQNLNIKLQDILDSGYTERDKAVCVTATYGNGMPQNYLLKAERQHKFLVPVKKIGNTYILDGKEFTIDLKGKFEGNKETLIAMKEYMSKLSPIELERLQGIPDNYTEGVSERQRSTMIGNGFTIPVIAHILKNMKI